MHFSKKSIRRPLLIVLPLVCFILTLCIGRYSITPFELWAAFSQKYLGIGPGVTPQIMTVVTEIRLPRAFIGLLVGASLAASGAAFQGLFRNPLVSGGILGVSSGAGFGAALSILIYNSVFMTPFYAFGFGILAVMLSYFCGRIDKTSPVITMVLGGTIVQSVFSALLSLLKYVADPSTQLPAITFWLMGSLASTKTSDLWLSCIPMAIGIIGLFSLRYRLNVLSMGDRESRALGINVTATKVSIIIFAALSTAGAVCVSGVIGWVGLIIPHIARIFVGSDNRLVIPTSLSLGACFVIICDTLCRTLTAGEIPLGIVTSLIGGP
ncbi:MAG: iron ABC transporter permease, partial [Eubacterium sp.]